MANPDQGAGLALDLSLAPTPPMGWNNWNTTNDRPDFNEQLVLDTADLFVESGLADAGYEYVNLDDCWALPERNAAGDLEPDTARFPRGIKFLADYVHGKGLKFGIYTSAGTKTCSQIGFPGALDHEEQDARLFASYEVDYLKYDNCNNQGRDARRRYTKMRDALLATGRPIVYSLCEWGQNQPWEWANGVGHLWRTTGDISDRWDSLLSLIKQNMVLDRYAGPGHWNDPDMLEVGNGGMSAVEYRTHFALWAVMAAPLLIGTVLGDADDESWNLLLNKEIIAVDQDPLGVQGALVDPEAAERTGLHVFAKPLSEGSVAVALFDANDEPAEIGTTLEEIGLGSAARGYTIRDLFTHESYDGEGPISARVDAHGTALYRVTPA